MRPGHVLFGGVAIFLGVILISTAGSLEPKQLAPTPPEVIIIGLFGVVSLIFGGLYGIGGLFAKQPPRTSPEKDFIQSFKEIGGIILIAGGAFGGLAMFIGLIRTNPGFFIAIFFLLVIFYLLLQTVLLPILTLVYRILGFIYEETKPKSALSKIVTFGFSIMFGLFWLQTIFPTGGLLTPVFVDPIGTVIAIVVSILFMVLGVVIIGVARAVLRRSLSSKENQRV